MGTVCDAVMDGKILSENRNGTIRDYAPDSLGSTVTLLDHTKKYYDYIVDGLGRTRQEKGGALYIIVWDGSDYLGEY